ncbi:MAG: hypothetical protein BWZ03_00664 [bacterium ADurb.BinA186]|nr:MAG: hypothetical protein BWZ03_00664 [bacterium ADurb.BinA186]
MPTATCPKCHRLVKLTMLGDREVIDEHPDCGEHCPGSLMPPAEAENKQED